MDCRNRSRSSNCYSSYCMSLLIRYRSLEQDTLTGKVVAALRNEFGGHAVEKK